jgi:cardiolipin synthase
VRIEILVGASEFWDRLAGDLAGARDKAWVQTLSFEGDSAGTRLADAMLACRAADRRILIDDYTRYWLSDRFIYSPRALMDPEMRAEARATRSMIAALRAGGVDARFVSRLGFLFRRLPARDHKKIVLIDGDVAYIGGINFSDHNFEWHDLMLRIEHADVGAFLQNDVLATWHGHASPARARFEGMELLSLNGADNESTLADVIALLAGAEEHVAVHNAYTTFPFCDALRAAAGRGVRVTVITPDVNNRGFMRDYMAWESARSGFELMVYPGRMSHLKAVLVDGRQLITGSSNFDWLTYTYQPEILAVIDRPDVIEAFRARVLHPDLAASTPANGHGDLRRGRNAYLIMRALAKVGRLVCPAERRPDPPAEFAAPPARGLPAGRPAA